MTKKEAAKAEEMKLVWKFKELPTASEVAKLVETGVIKPEEGRNILFREEEKKSDEVEALKAMVEALQEMVKDLISRQSNITLVPYTKVVEVPKRFGPYWVNAVGGSGTISLSSTAGYNSGTTQYTMSVNA